MPSTCDHLFVYGTLIPGLEPPEMSSVCRQLQFVSSATVRGRLYDLGEYPGLVLEDSDSLVQGRVVKVRSQQIWHAMDEYEGCPLPDSPEGLFRRVLTEALLVDARLMTCWTYVYSRSLDGAARVEGGCWLSHRAGSKIDRK